MIFNSIRNGISVSLISIITLATSNAWDITQGNLELESGGNLLQESGSLILLE